MEVLLRQRMERLLALTSSPNENEAALALQKLQELLTRHNLDISFLEAGGQQAPKVGEKDFDLQKSAFPWKLNLAEVIAKHFYCYPIVNHKAKTVRFVGRPDNVESLTSLYAWIIEQIRTISRNERYVWMEENNEHVDPLRWQLNFGLGIVDRLGDRLNEIARKRIEDNQVHALVVHHESEISDYLEETLGYRIDGQETKSARERREQYQAKMKFKTECEENGDMEAYYAEYPYERPQTDEEKAKYEELMAEVNKEWEKRNARSERSRRAAETRRANKGWNSTEYRRANQAYYAEQRGQASAAQINLQPFLNSGVTEEELTKIGS